MPAGRPTKYKPEYAEQAERLCLLGHTNDELAHVFGVNVSTIEKWIREIDEFSRAIYAGREGADQMVARALYRRACGMTIVEERPGQEGGTIATTKEIPPDPQAMKFWLMNRQRAKWTDQTKVEHSTPDGQPLILQVVEKKSAD